MFNLMLAGDPMRGVPSTPRQATKEPQADASLGWWGEVMQVRSSAPDEQGAGMSQVRTGIADEEYENAATASAVAMVPWTDG
jgi:hypothetical protein